MRRPLAVAPAIAVAISALLSVPLPAARAGDVEDALAEANALIKDGKGKEARARLAPVAAAHPDSAPLQYGLAQAAVLEKDFPAAQKHLEKTVELDAAHVDARLVLAELYRQGKRAKDAKKQLDEVLKRAPENASAMQGEGDLERDAKHWPEAVAWYEKALAIRKDNLKLLDRVASSWAESVASLAGKEGAKKKREEHGAKAIAAYRRLIELSPDDPAWLFNLGVVGYQCDRPDEASEALEKYLEKRPDEPHGLQLLAMVREKQSRAADACALWKKFVEAAKADKQLAGQIPYAKERIKALEKK